MDRQIRSGCSGWSRHSRIWREARSEVAMVRGAGWIDYEPLRNDQLPGATLHPSALTDRRFMSGQRGLSMAVADRLGELLSLKITVERKREGE